MQRRKARPLALIEQHAVGHDLEAERGIGFFRELVHQTTEVLAREGISRPGDQDGPGVLE